MLSHGDRVLLLPFLYLLALGSLPGRSGLLPASVVIDIGERRDSGNAGRDAEWPS